MRLALVGSTVRPASYHICAPPLFETWLSQPPFEPSKLTPPEDFSVQVVPPSSLRKIERMARVTASSTSTYKRWRSFGARAISMRPSVVALATPLPVPTGQLLLRRVQLATAGHPD